MEILQDTFPIFEANQILSDSHLNQVFDYLDEQERLTRANLIGIGIVCGLELRLDDATSTMQLSKGCGVTSEGYLIMEPNDVTLVSYRSYTLPGKSNYPAFKDKLADGQPQYTLHELFPKGEQGTIPLASTPNFLKDKAVLLFLELKKEDLRNCSPNDCNDGGTQVTTTLRRLLIRTADLKKIIAIENRLEPSLTFTDLETALLAKINLPDLRMPRFDIPNSNPTTSKAVLTGFHAVFRTEKLAERTGAALTAAYQAFKPLVQAVHPTDPFAGFFAKFGFLDTAPNYTNQVLFLQYYYDFFADLQSAYDEFRWKGADLLCACCPPNDLFPLHLMLGVVDPSSVGQPRVFRHSFLASPATNDCERLTKELQLLFQRLVELTNSFTYLPSLAAQSDSSDDDDQIRITPSKLADVPLSEKAIPYYYRQKSDPPLYQLWNAEKSRRNRANQNLSYRSDEYTPAAPSFVLDPLRYDIEPYNFLRIEGHLGKPFRDVLSTLLGLKTRHRLPIDIIALRTGVFDEDIPVDLSREKARFLDLETLYDTLREDLLCTLCEAVRYLYNITIEMPDTTPADFTLPGGVPQIPLLKNHAPNYRHKQGTVGAWFEQHLELFQSRPYIDVDQNRIDTGQVLLVYCVLFAGTASPTSTYFAHIVAIYYCMKLSEILPDSLNELGYDDFENKYQDLMGLVRYFRSDAVERISSDLEEFIPQEELIDYFDQVLFACKFEPIKATHEEYIRRVREVKQKHFLGSFLQNHPGIEHKAGVPFGGTFILVYHEEPAAEVTELRGILEELAAVGPPPITAEFNWAAFADVVTRIGTDPQLGENREIRRLIGTFTGEIRDIDIALPPSFGVNVGRIIDATVNGLDNGTIIADFFLPYQFSSDCSSVQYLLPLPPPGLTVELGCTESNGTAEATLTPHGGTPPFTYQRDEQPYRDLPNALLLPVGSHTLRIRDSAGTVSASQSLTVPEPLAIGAEHYAPDIATSTYTVNFAVSGGVSPYTALPGTVTDSTFTSQPVKSGDTISVTVTDSTGCTISKDFTHTIPSPPLGLRVELDCTDMDGIARATFNIEGGVEPISYRLNDQPFQVLPDTLPLTVGLYTLVIRDSVGAVSALQSITVPEPLAIGEITYTDDGAANTYTVTFDITGGTRPYRVNNDTVDDATYTSQPVNSGDTSTMIITDSVDCNVVESVTHNVEDPCDLPCDGQSRRCAYRLWLQRPSDTMPYSSYRRNGNVLFRFEGIDIVLADPLLRIPVADLNSDFDGEIARAIKALNTAISEVLVSEFGEESRYRFSIAYAPNATDPFDVVRIEHFVCDTFSIEFGYSFTMLKPSGRLTMRYTNEVNSIGVAILRLNNEETTVPAFDCSERNLCDDTDFIPLCEGPDPELSFETVQDSPNRFVLIGNVNNLNEAGIIAWIWDLPQAQPAKPFYEGKESIVVVGNPSSQVKLTAITENGCFGTATGDLG